MKNNSRYLGSVKFYKHLILTVTALLILTPTIGLLFMLAQNWKLKQIYYVTFNEQLRYVSQLEGKLAYFNNTNTESNLETKESQRMPEAPATKNLANENMPLIPFSVDLEELKYILVNDSQPLPKDFQPELVEIQNGQLVHKEILASLEQMLYDAEQEGLHIIVCSAYRDYERQAELVQNSIEQLLQEGYDYTEAHWKTKLHTATVGRSEHHTGLAVDIVGKSHQTLDEDQANTLEGQWLAEHAHKYGFILRYPKGKEDITGIMYESWHYRYVGEVAASFIKEQALCLEEFHELVSKQ